MSPKEVAVSSGIAGHPAGSGGDHGPEMASSHWRWFVLFTFMWLGFAQCLAWFTFSSVPSRTTAYFPMINTTHIDFLLNLGPIMFVPICPFVSWLQTGSGRFSGLKVTFWCGTVLTFLGSVVRCIPTMMSEEFRSSETSVLMLDVAQALNAAAGPFIMVVCSKISMVWFPESQRATSTALIYVSNNGLGTAMGFLLGPILVGPLSSAADNGAGNGPDEGLFQLGMPLFLYVVLLISAVPVLLGAIYFPERPKVPPSMAAHLFAKGELYDQNFIKGVNDALKCWSLLGCIVVGGVISGVTAAWQGVLPQVFDEVEVLTSRGGMIGAAQSFAGIAGGLLAGPVVDRFFARNFKIFLLACLVTSASALVCFTLMLPTPIDANQGLIQSNLFAILSSVVIAGFFEGTIGPILFELCAEVGFPVPESTSGGMLQFVNNVAVMIFLFAAPYISVNYFNLIEVGATIFCVLLLLMVRERYARSEADEHNTPANPTTPNGEKDPLLNADVAYSVQTGGYPNNI
eukprot:TRINITY_DN7516_c0_g1_i1.p1 TRINITY_DN7516_c0_g1~~TRINITY_DN7516_c0_g1_i1.p1  ORF type:complete len:515 (+),score=47.71 TRINITY_DN7516_c0_g1_i1:276-1820(+)